MDGDPAVRGDSHPKNGKGIGEVVFFLPFLLIGGYMLIGRYIVDAKRRAQTFYGVTNQRILIVVAAARAARLRFG